MTAATRTLNSGGERRRRLITRFLAGRPRRLSTRFDRRNARFKERAPQNASRPIFENMALEPTANRTRANAATARDKASKSSRSATRRRARKLDAARGRERRERNDARQTRRSRATRRDEFIATRTRTNATQAVGCAPRGRRPASNAAPKTRFAARKGRATTTFGTQRRLDLNDATRDGQFALLRVPSTGARNVATRAFSNAALKSARADSLAPTRAARRARVRLQAPGAKQILAAPERVVEPMWRFEGFGATERAAKNLVVPTTRATSRPTRNDDGERDEGRVVDLRQYAFPALFAPSRESRVELERRAPRNSRVLVARARRLDGDSSVETPARRYETRALNAQTTAPFAGQLAFERASTVRRITATNAAEDAASVERVRNATITNVGARRVQFALAPPYGARSSSSSRREQRVARESTLGAADVAVVRAGAESSAPSSRYESSPNLLLAPPQASRAFASVSGSGSGQARRFERERALGRGTARFVEPAFALGARGARWDGSSVERRSSGLNDSSASGYSSFGDSSRILESIESLLRDSRDSLAALTRADRGDLTLVTSASGQ